MKRFLFLLLLAAGAARAGSLQLSDFSDFQVGYYSQSALGPWSESTAQVGATAFSVGNFASGTPSGNIGNGFIQWLGDATQDWSTFGYVNLSGFAAPSNATPHLSFYLEDVNGTNSILTQFDLSDFSTGPGTFSISLLGGGVDLSQVAFWGFTVGEADSPDFGFTFDHVSLSTDRAPAPIPDSSSSVLLLGLGLIGLATLRRVVPSL